MPWCDECSKFWSPNSLPASGACPTCGRTLRAPTATATAPAPAATGGTAAHADQADDYKAPWHFKLMIVLAVVYLTWRFIQVISWVV